MPGVNMPWHYAPVMLLITTPLITLGAAIGGLCRLFLRNVGATFLPAPIVPAEVRDYRGPDPHRPGSGMEQTVE